jgi:hypothetical protein
MNHYNYDDLPIPQGGRGGRGMAPYETLESFLCKEDALDEKEEKRGGSEGNFLMIIGDMTLALMGEAFAIGSGLRHRTGGAVWKFLRMRRDCSHLLCCASAHLVIKREAGDWKSESQRGDGAVELIGEATSISVSVNSSCSSLSVPEEFVRIESEEEQVL